MPFNCVIPPFQGGIEWGIIETKQIGKAPNKTRKTSSTEQYTTAPFEAP